MEIFGILDDRRHFGIVASCNNELEIFAVFGFFEFSESFNSEGDVFFDVKSVEGHEILFGFEVCGILVQELLVVG